MEPECLLRMSSTRDGKRRGRSCVDSSFDIAVGVRIIRKGIAGSRFDRRLRQRRKPWMLGFDDLRYSERKNQQSCQVRFLLHTFGTPSLFYSLLLLVDGLEALDLYAL